MKALRIVRTVLQKFSGDEMATYAAALAYRVLFSLFPFLVFLTTLLGFLGMPELFDWMRTQAAYLLPAEAMNLVNSVVTELETPQGGLMSVAVALAVWSASAAMLGTMDALNVAFDVKERRPVWKRLLVSLVYTVALALMIVIAASLMVTGPDLLGWLSHYVGLDAAFVALWALLRWPVAVFLLLLVIALVYWAAPNAKVPFRIITPGAVLAFTIWIGASVAFGFYVANFASYNKTYGSMGAVIVLLLYFFISAAVMLLGAELNAVLARERGERVQQATGGGS